jgi:ribosomal-protein-alanine N-acetyltransferase
MQTLETTRLRLRKWQASDLADMYEYASVPGVGEMAGWPHHTGIEVTEGILEKFIAGDEVFAVVLKETGKVIGSLGVHRRTRDENYPVENQREIGYVLSRDYWGQGLMPEAVRAAITYAFEQLHVDVLWCGHFTHNPQSQRVVEKTGFRYYRDSTRDTVLGKTFDEKQYIMTKEDYISCYKNLP